MLPIRIILWAGNDPNHQDHLHVEGDPAFIGFIDGTGTQPPSENPGMTPSVQSVYDALVDEFGPTKYYESAGSASWTHMGWYNRRPIAESRRWSQHAYANALDIGPYIGVAAQQKFYDFLTREEDDMPTIEELEQMTRRVVREELDRLTDGKPGPASRFYGLGGAVVSTLIGRTERTLGQMVQNTDNQLVKVQKQLDALENDG